MKKIKLKQEVKNIIIAIVFITLGAIITYYGVKGQQKIIQDCEKALGRTCTALEIEKWGKGE